MPLKTPAISRPVIEPSLSTTALTGQNLRAFTRNDEWIAIESRTTQLLFIEQFAELSELTRSRVRAIHAKVQRKQRPPCHPLVLSDEQEFELCQMIRDKAVTSNYVKQRGLINYIEANFRTRLTYAWIRCFLQGRADEVRKAIVAPGELPRLEVPRRHLDHDIELIKK
jgi:hypothetical protein